MEDHLAKRLGSRADFFKMRKIADTYMLLEMVSLR